MSWSFSTYLIFKIQYITGKENSNDILYLLRIESFSHNMTIRDKLILTMLFYQPAEMSYIYM